MKKTVRIIAMLTASVLIFGECVTEVYAKSGVAAGEKKTYTAGEKTGGFIVSDTYDFESFDAKVSLFSHTQSGAKVVLIQNDDPNRFFMLEFDTKAENNKGTAHVLEHSIMSGSAKYPSRSLAGALSSRAYLTYMNAFTKNASTSFPVASLSEKQLLKMAQYYTDLCFDPMILRDEDIFSSEAWRFTVDDVSGKLGVNGTIYSEMSGRYSSDMAAMAKAAGLLYPGCPSSYIAGGIPQDILTLSYEEVKDFYKKYYKPSECTAYLYGDIKDAKAFLDLLDERFSGYEVSQKDSADIAGGKALAASSEKEDTGVPVYVEKKYDFPAPAGTIYTGDMVYATDLGALPDDKLTGLYAFARCLGRDHSTPVLKLGALFPGASFDFAVIPDGGNIMFTVSAHGVDENYASEFRSAVLGILKEIAVNGLREKELGYFKSRMETDAALSREGSQAAADLLMSTVNYSSNGRDILTYMKLRDMMRDMSWFDNDLIKSVASSLATPRRSAMAIVTPRPGLLEAERQKRDEALEKFGSSMTDAEKKKIADDEKRIVEAASDDPAEYVKGLSVTGIADLSDEIKTYSVGDSTDDRGMRHVGVYSSTKGVYVTKICLDASAVPADMLGYLSLYVDLVNGRFVPTGKYGQDELADMISCCNRGQDISLTVSSLGKNFRPYVAVQFMCAPEMTQTAFDLAYERLFDSKFEDPVKIRDGVTSIRQVTGDNIASNQGQTARYIAYSDDAPGAAYYENTHYLEYYDFLKKVEDNIGGDYKNVCAKLNEIGELIRYTDSSVIGYVLPKEEEKQYLKISEGFEKKLKDTGKKENRYEFEKYGEATGLITGSAVAGNVAAVGDISKYGIEEDDAALALSLSLVNEKYLRKMTRDRYGAYTCSYAEEYPVVSVFTARDPVIKETYDAFSGLKDAWSDIKASLTQSELEEYITKMYSQEMLPSGDISDAMKVLSDMIAWRGADRRKRRCAQLKDATVQRLSKYDKLFENIGTKGRKVSTGDAQLINDNKDVFAKVIDPFAK